MFPADGDDVLVAIAIYVNQLRAVVVFVTDGHLMALEARAGVLIDEDAALLRVGLVMLAGHDVGIAVAIHVTHVQAHRADDGVDHVFRPQLRWVGRSLIPGQQARLADRFVADHDVGAAVAAHVNGPVAVGVLVGLVQRVLVPAAARILQPGRAQQQVEVAVAIDVGRAQVFAGGRRRNVGGGPLRRRRVGRDGHAL